MPLVVLRSVLEGVGRLVPNSPYEPVRERAAKWLVYSLCDAFACVFVFVRDRAQRRAFEQTIGATIERLRAQEAAEQVDGMLAAMVPATVLPRLMGGDAGKDTTVDCAANATVLFSDIVGFTAWSGSRTAAQVVTMLNELCVEFDAAAVDRQVEKCKTIGDAYWCLAGLPTEAYDHASRVTDFAADMLTILRRGNRRHPEWKGVAIRIGVHSGPLRGAVLGTRQWSYECFGATNAVASLVEQHGVANTVAVSGVTRDQLAHEGALVGVSPDPICAFDAVVADESATDVQVEVFTLELAEPRLDDGDVAVGDHVSVHSRRSHHTHRSGGTSVGAAGTRFDQEAERARAERRRFLGEKVAAQRRKKYASGDGVGSPAADGDDQCDAAGGASDDLDDALAREVARLSERKHGWLFQDWADAGAEAEFREAYAEANAPLRRLVRALFPVFIVMIFVGVAVQGGSTSLNATSVTLLVVCLLTSIGVAVVSFVTVPGDIVDTVMMADHVTVCAVGLLALFGVWAMDDGITMGNDPVYVAIVFFCPIAHTLSGISAPTYTALHLVAAVTVIAMSLRSPLLSNIATTWPLIVVVSSAAAFIREANARIAVRARAVAKHQRRVQRAQAEARQVLLETVVPAHVTAPLQHWIGALHMDPAQSIARAYDNVSVAFVEMRPVSHTSAAGDAGHWLTAAHARIDEVLAGADGASAAFPAVVKVKTIGSQIMLAGAFELELYDAGVAASQLLLAVSAIVAAVGDVGGGAGASHQRLQVAAGLNSGPVVGAVLGLNRLAFDVFGDTVNTASRVLSSGLMHARAEQGTPEGDAAMTARNVVVHASSAFLATLGVTTAFGADDVVLHAKGKGDLVARRLVRLPGLSPAVAAAEGPLAPAAEEALELTETDPA